MRNWSSVLITHYALRIALVYQSLFLRRNFIPATAINSAKISRRPTIKIIMQKIFPNADKVLKFSASHKPGKFPTVDKHAIDIATDSEKVLPVKLKTAAQINIVTSARKKKLKILPAVFIGTGMEPTRIAVIMRG